MNNTRRPPTLRSMASRRRGLHGVALIEVLVAILILAFGVLGIVGLQASMTSAQSAAKFRGDAASLVSELVGILWVESVANRANYTTANCANQPACLDWQNKVASSLPGGSSALSIDTTTGEVSITLTWNVPNEGQHSYVSRTNVLQ